MKRVTGFGGIFFHSTDPVTLRAWYRKHLGIDVQEWGGAMIPSTDADGKPVDAMTIWNLGDAASNAFAPGTAPFMINYRVADLDALVQVLKTEGCNVLGDVEASEYGKFAWVLDPDGNKIELWEPPAGE